MSRRALTLAAAGFLVVVLSAVAALLPVPYVALSPGPTTNTLGAMGKTTLIRIDGRQTYPATGHLDLTTVSVLGGPRQRLDLVTALRGWLDDEIAILPEEQVYPKGETAEQAERESAAQMKESQENATTAALRQLGIPVTTKVVVDTVSGGSPAQGLLRPGDVIREVDGQAVDGGARLREVITRHRPGEQVRLVVERGGARVETSVRTAKAADGRAIIGILTRDDATYPFTVDISLEDVGGPSAGLMFALGIVDKLTPGALTGGRYVAGTGTIDDTGKVGPIGGITQKLLGAHDAGASVFLVPADDCEQAVKTAPEGLRLVKVDTLATAVDALDALRAGRTAQVPTCSG
ncbi:MAG TPA: PDZ domain-containing protein [Actinomycetes bacterium]